MSEWVRVASLSEIPVGAGLEVVAGGRILALFRTGDNQVSAMDGICPHNGGPLAKGQLVGDVVTCPWHGWQFQVTTGQHCLNAKLQHPCFPVEIRGTDVWAEV